ncbi:phage regulatory CII family protein [Allosphingosinicella indica]|uniref:Uncharacterized protein n=1 Tax=Allosphingosinicella indica TaxID=941907 RepID=A0A1X7GL07_9SPHN|nr:phage regulatory CII family protein [Allosphingosinicella indica]SMF70647.1 hypothetical protein SAMN06295910_1922 [Allosphingosinicella indica]
MTGRTAQDRRMVQLPPELQAGKARSKSLIRAAGGQEAAAEVTGKSQARMSSCGVPNTADFLSIADVRSLEAVTHGTAGHPLVTRWLASEAGYALVRLPGAGQPETAWSQRAAKLLREGGDIISGIGAALENDNDVCGKEAAALLNEADELVAIAVEIQSALKARARGTD